MCWNSGVTYAVEYSDNLTAARWLALTNLTADSSGLYRFVDVPPAGRTSRFYRSQW
jgi:hypothetical protein